MVALAALFTSASFAETENFNMALTGDVIKDYCTIDAPLTSFDFGTIDTSDPSAYNPRFDDGFIEANVHTISSEQNFSITCSTGVLYQVYPDIPETGHAIGLSTVMGFSIHDGDSLNGVGMSNRNNKLLMGGDGTSQTVFVKMWFASKTDDLNDLEDSINTVVPWVIQTL